MPLLSLSEWQEFSAAHPQAHILQSGAWGELKSHFGWRALRLKNGQAGAQVLFRRLPLGLSIAYLPKGPLGDCNEHFWTELDRLCRRQRAIFLKVEPDAWEESQSNLDRQFSGWIPTAPIQPARTVVVDLSGSEEDWLGRMKQKTRYNIRLAERKGVLVHPSADLEAFWRLVEQTGRRDGFGVHTAEYYRLAHALFEPAGNGILLLAEYEGKALAGIMVFRGGRRAWYFYGASSDEERNRMPAYLLQWEGMRWAAAHGCLEYDLWGIPDLEEDALEDGFSEKSGGLWGVYRFKRGFGGAVRRSAGAWDRVYNPLFYRLYRWYVARRGEEGG